MIALANDEPFERLDVLFDEHYKPEKLLATSKDNTRLYGVSFRRFGRYLNHYPRSNDLTDKKLSGFLDWMLSQGRSPYTANCYRSKLIALWQHLAKTRIVDQFPTIGKLKEPRRIPRAWSVDQLATLFNACDEQPETICGIPASLWWHGIHAVIWDTGERISATLALAWCDLTWDSRFLISRAENRKGKTEDKAFKLHPDTIHVLRLIRNHSKSDLIFPIDFSTSTLYNRYHRLLETAGLPTGRKFKFHCIRKSVASYFKAAGGDATKLLGHSDSRVTDRSYIDPTIVDTDHASDVLFRPRKPTDA